MRITDRLLHAWNAFTTASHTPNFNMGMSSSRPAHSVGRRFSTTSYVSSIYNRIAIDVSMTTFKHVKIDPENEDMHELKTGLNDCLRVEANIDQTHIQFIQDAVYSMFDEGSIAIVPVDTTADPKITGGFDINSLRVGKILNWFPKHVEVQLYNERTGQNENIVLEKKTVAIIENPLYAVVNDENSTLKRLIRKLNEMDDVDSAFASGRLDLLINLPFGIKTDKQRNMARERIQDIELQLAKGRNGIAYIDGTEKVTQLNRPVNDQLNESVTTLRQEFYNQLGLTETVFNGTASESEMRTYYTRTIDPIIDNIVSEMNRKFITKTARTQGHTIIYYRDMFKMVPVETIASLGDTLRRNSVATSNEIRKIVGFKPSNDPKADELFNPNIADKNQNPDTPPAEGIIKPKGKTQEIERMERKVERLSKEE